MKDLKRESKREVTIADVAAKSGVSIATVSRVLNRTGRYSLETSARCWKLRGSWAIHQTIWPRA